MQKLYEGNLVEIFRFSQNVYFRKADLHTRHQCNGAFLVGNSSIAVIDVSSTLIPPDKEKGIVPSIPTKELCIFQRRKS